MSFVLTTKVPGGNYTPEESTTCINMGTFVGNGDDWMAYSAQQQDSWGPAVYDIVTMAERSQVTVDDLSGRQFLTVNATLAAANQAAYILPFDDGTEKTRYTPVVGTLGLGVAPRGIRLNGSDPVGVLRALKENGVIGYEGFGLHMGSVRHNQPGSLVLGGYDKNRALGQVGTFRFMGEDLPYMFLVDVLLGNQLPGASSGLVGGSIWQRPNESLPDGEGEHSATFVRQALGGKEGTAIVVPNPAVPYIYLPQGICEAVADRLPLVYNEKLNLHTWDMKSPAYEKLMKSSAYMAFVLSDSMARNLTIKVPFQLLNLTLESPLVYEPTPYFPCQSLDPVQYGFCTFGRAFLQAAFFGVDYERNVTYLAQAPGPIMEQRVVKEFSFSGEGMETNDIAQFEGSWLGVWEAGEDQGSLLSTGAIAGIVVGAVAGVGVSGFAVWRLLMGRGSERLSSAPTLVEKMDDTTSCEKVEMDTERDVAELGVKTAQDMGGQGAVHEASDLGKVPPERRKEVPDSKPEWVELPADVPIELLTTGRNDGGP